MAIQTIANQLRSLRDRYWNLVADAFRDIEQAFLSVYRDMGWFSFSENATGIRKDVLQSPRMMVIGGKNNTVIGEIRNLDGKFVILVDPQSSLGAMPKTWTGATASWFGVPVFWQSVWELAANTTITSPVAPQPGAFLIVYVVAHATSFYTFTFDSSDFVDSSVNHSPDAGKVSVHFFTGRDDGKWWPIVTPRVGLDPTA